MSKRFRQRKKSLIERSIGTELVLVDPVTGYVHQLNAVAACIWRGLVEDRDTETLAGMLQREFEVDAETARRDVMNFVTELSRLEMIEERTQEP